MNYIKLRNSGVHETTLFKGSGLEFPQIVIEKRIYLPKAPICRFMKGIEWQS